MTNIIDLVEYHKNTQRIQSNTHGYNDIPSALGARRPGWRALTSLVHWQGYTNPLSATPGFTHNSSWNNVQGFC